MNGNTKSLLAAVTVFAAIGAVFCAFSSYDFILHLDRQVHAINCSYIPGTGSLDETGSSGCYAVMISPFSSILRSLTWGGIPIALPGLSVFAYLLFLSIYLLASGSLDRNMGLYLLAATFLPVLTSAYYFYISVAVVGSVCKLCVGIYFASAGVFLSSILAYFAERPASFPGDRSPWGRWAVFFFEGVVFVAVPVALYLMLKPAPTAAQMQCGNLMSSEDKYGVMVQIHPAAGGQKTVEVVDPLCPACAAFSKALKNSGSYAKLDIKGVLFPLEKDCNWMIPQTLHPGSCAVSEAVVCAQEGKAAAVLDWALANNEEIRKVSRDDPQAAYAAVRQAFPDLASCVGSPEAKSRINKSLRWIVSNSLPVLTPQLYIEGRRLCAEDTDLGLEYALGKLLNPEEKPGEAGEAGPAKGAAGHKQPVKR
jgi:uncharacterized membrane protein